MRMCECDGLIVSFYTFYLYSLTTESAQMLRTDTDLKLTETEKKRAWNT